MNQGSLSKKRRDTDTLMAELETIDPSSGIKVMSSDEKSFKIKGQTFYESIFIKKSFKEGCYIIGVDDSTKDTKKYNPKACFRVGVVCHTEDEDNDSRNHVYSLGSCKNSIALRSSDLAVIQDGLVRLKVTSSDLLIDKGNASDSESMVSTRIKNELSHDYYVVICLKNPKNPDMIKYFKDKLPAANLLYSKDSYIAFYKGSSLVAKVSNIREGTYSLGFSLYMEAAVTVNMAPSIATFRQDVARCHTETAIVQEKMFDAEILDSSQKASEDVAVEEFSSILESQ